MSRKKLTVEETFPGLPDRINKMRGGLSQEEFGRLIGVSKPMVSKYESGSAAPSRETLMKIAEVGRKPLKWLLHGDEATEPKRAVSGFILKDPVMIPSLESRVTAGPDGEILYEKLGEKYPFKRWWIEKLVGKGVDRQKDLMLIRVKGDSMSPIISSGDLVMVDFSEQERSGIKPGRIYLITQPDGGTSIKKVVLDHSEHKLICISDNPAYQPFEIKLDADQRLKRYVLGRVRWVGKEFA